MELALGTVAILVYVIIVVCFAVGKLIEHFIEEYKDKEEDR